MQANRILVTGSSELPGEQGGFAGNFARELGYRLVIETSATVVTGGLVARGPGRPPAVDGLVVKAALSATKNEADAHSRIITMLPAAQEDNREFVRIDAGTVIRVSYAGPRTRRYSMVLTSDAVVAICGAEATREVVDLAYIAGKPLIPVPSTGGAALRCWEQYCAELTIRLGLRGDEIQALHDETVVGRGVSACLGILRRVIRPRCFVAMPFTSHPLANTFETIASVAQERGYQVVRIDRESFSGNIVEAIWESIRHCDLAVVDLTGHRPNVYYEMGIAHALNKPTVLISYSSSGTIPDDVPFDIKVQRILAYGTTQSLRKQLDDMLPSAAVEGRAFSAMRNR